MKVLVTGVGGQLGHDVMNELASRGYEGIGSDIKETYSGIAGWYSGDNNAVCTDGYHRCRRSVEKSPDRGCARM